MSRPRCAPLRRARLRRRSALGAPCRGSEPRPPASITTRAPPAPTRTGRWRWSLSSGLSPPAPRPRPRLRRSLGGGRESRAHARPGRPDPPNPRQPRKRSSRGGPGPRGIVRRRGSPPAGRRSPACRGRLRADRRRAPLARGREAGLRACPRSSARPRTATRSCSGSSRTSRARTSRRSRRRAPTPSCSTSSGSRPPRWRSVSASKPAVSNRLRLLELPDDVLELVRGARTRGPRSRDPRGSRPRRSPAARAAHRAGRVVRAGDRAGGPGGVARRHGRRTRRTTRLARHGAVGAARRLGVSVRSPAAGSRSPSRARRSSSSSSSRSSGRRRRRLNRPEAACDAGHGRTVIYSATPGRAISSVG